MPGFERSMYAILTTPKKLAISSRRLRRQQTSAASRPMGRMSARLRSRATMLKPMTADISTLLIEPILDFIFSKLQGQRAPLQGCVNGLVLKSDCDETCDRARNCTTPCGFVEFATSRSGACRASACDLDRDKMAVLDGSVGRGQVVPMQGGRVWGRAQLVYSRQDRVLQQRNRHCR